MKILAAVILSAVLVMSVFASSQSFGMHDNHSSLKMTIDKTDYLQGETIELSGAVTPLKENVPVHIEIWDPFGDKYIFTEILPEQSEVNSGSYSYNFSVAEEAPLGIWNIHAKYSSQYMSYGSANALFRVSDSIDIVSTPLAQITVDGIIDSSSGEWAHKYDTKHWTPFVFDPREIEGNIAFNAYYVNGILYASFDIPDKVFHSKDFVELGIDVNNVGEEFQIGDEVYIFKIYRDGTYESFRLGTEHVVGQDASHYFSAKADEAGDIRIQIFDQDGNFVEAFESLRNTSSKSYKGVLGVAGIEVDQEGNLFLLDSDSGVVSKFDARGEFQGAFGSLGTDIKEFIDPTGIALDSEGNIYVADTGNARVQKFDKQSKFVGAFGSMGILSVGMMQAGDDSGENIRHDLFESPEGITVDPSGEIFVVDRRAGTVSVFDGDGNYVKSFGSLVNPSSIAIDSRGYVYVVEQGNNRIIKSDQNGNIILTWGTFGNDDGLFKNAYGIAIDSGDNVYVSDSVNHSIQKFDGNGNFIAKWGTIGVNPGELNGPHGLAIDSSDNIYVADANNYRVQKFDSVGEFVMEMGTKGTALGEFNKPRDVTLDSEGNIYVTDVFNKRVQKFDGDGTVQLEWGTNGVGNGEFRGPFGIAIDAADSIYVADPLNRRIQKFDSGGNMQLRWGSGEFKEASSISDIPNDGNYIAMESNSHEPIGVIDRKLVNENGVGSYFIESGSIWKIQHIFRDTVYIKSLDYVRNEDPVLSWTPDGIDVDSYGNVYIVDRENEVAKKFEPNGKLVSKWGSTGVGEGEFSKPTAMKLDSENNVFIVDTGNNRMQKFDSEGNYITAWGSLGEESGKFNDPRGIDIDRQDNVYVLDNGNNRVQKFDSNGNFITEWGSQGSSSGQFDNLSTEGITVDPEGRVYIADLPGENRASHWIAEVAIPLFAKGDTFRMFLAEGTYGDHQAVDLSKADSVNIYDVYRNAWPSGAISVLPETWAKATLVDIEEIKVESEIIIDTVRSCTKEICSDLNDFTNPVPTGDNVIVTSRVVADTSFGKFEYDGTQVTLQYSLDGEEWTDVDSKFVLVSKEVPAAVTLKWTPMDSGEAMIRVISSGLLTEESTSDLMTLKVEESDSFKIRANVEWSPDRIMQDEPVEFELEFTGADENMLQSLNYDLRIIEDDVTVADLPLVHIEDGKDMFKYRFKHSGLHILQVHVNAIGDVDDFIPMKKIFNYKIDVQPVDTPLKVTTIQKGEAMKIKLKNRDIGNLRLNSIVLNLTNIDKVNFKLPESWTSSLNTESMTIQFSTEENPLSGGDSMEFIVRSKAFVKSLYSVCWDLEQSALEVKVC